MIINSNTAEKRYAYMKKGKIEALYIEQPGQQSNVGNIYLGLVEKVVPGMNAAFINIGTGKSGYLHLEKLPAFVLGEGSKTEKLSRGIGRYIHQGERILVQVDKDETGSKGARLTAIVELKGDILVYMPSGNYIAASKKHSGPEIRKKMMKLGEAIRNPGEGIIFRTSASQHSQEAVAAELQELRNLFSEIERKAEKYKKPCVIHKKDTFYEALINELDRLKPAEIVSDQPEMRKRLARTITRYEGMSIVPYNGKENIFSFYGVEQEIEKALHRLVWLENGAYLIMDDAEALTIIDVNTGKFTGKSSLDETVFAVNKLAAREIARQIRLRDIGGIILVDFIDMKDDASREEIVRILSASLGEDGRRTRILGFTSLGILQLTRKKTKRSLGETLMEKCRVCNGTGKVISPETVAFRLERELFGYRGTEYEAVRVEADEKVVKLFLENDGEHKAYLENSTGLTVVFTVVPSETPFYSIRKLGSVEEIAGE
ncbi:Rne/Rng family ribonuclease [Bacillus massilinigeriensis]|uniref:Rne/Rng family ribonuclease n=1 Tax=Bacillus mediterraneensis TaxID=1805474 RepID=UPI0008F8985C|nr:Rne/Rng family ribonuclease [Bacillus mediterraneensis]